MVGTKLKKIIFMLLIFNIIYVILLSIVNAERSYTLNEVVASVICAEACGEGEVGMYAVANVIANRSRKYNITPYEVVKQKNQFYGYIASNREELYNQCGKIADRLTANIMKLDDITNGAIFFKTINEKKRSWHQVFTIKIGNHLFYK